MANLIIRDANSNNRELMVGGEGTTNDPFYSVHEQRETGPQKTLIYRKIDLIGDGLGVTNMNVNGSVTPAVFKIKPSLTEVFRISQMMIMIEDSGTFDAGGWGNNGGTPLTNGVQVRTVINSVQTNWLQTPVKSHADIAAIAFDFAHHEFGSGNEFVVAKWRFIETGQYVRLDGANGDEMQVIVQDDLTFLTRQDIYVCGYIE